MELLNPFLDVKSALDYLSFNSLIYTVLSILLIVIGKVVYDLFTPFNLDRELGDRDNKALAISYSGYLVSMAIIIIGVLHSPQQAFLIDIVATVAWSLAGIILLNLSALINNKIILSKFDNVQEIIRDSNVGTAAVEAGSYIGSAFVINSVVGGESEGILGDILSTVIFYLVAQVCFVLFGVAYQRITVYDVHKEIENDNVAAGVTFGMSLLAIGVILSHIITLTSSLAALAVWFLNGSVLIILTRWFIDKLLLPKHSINREIQHDRNWGIALIEGCSVIMVAFIINASF